MYYIAEVNALILQVGKPSSMHIEDNNLLDASPKLATNHTC
jgi:hypothetical protein